MKGQNQWVSSKTLPKKMMSGNFPIICIEQFIFEGVVFHNFAFLLLACLVANWICLLQLAGN